VPASLIQAGPGASAPDAAYTLYVLVRTDIAPCQQAVQAAHAAAEAARRFYRPEHGVARLVILALAGPEALERCRAHLLERGIEHEVFFEPDAEMGESAIGTRPLHHAERRALGRYPLWRTPCRSDA
jgi:hypothetical protein